MSTEKQTKIKYSSWQNGKSIKFYSLFSKEAMFSKGVAWILKYYEHIFHV